MCMSSNSLFSRFVLIPIELMNREPAQQTDQFSNRESVNRGPTVRISVLVPSICLF